MRTEYAIDVRRLDTYPTWVAEVLRRNKEELFLHRQLAAEQERLRAEGDYAMPLAQNPYSEVRSRVLEHEIMPRISEEHIVGWHYTRLLDFEVDRLKTIGIQVGTVERFEERFLSILGKGLISKCEYQKLLNDSPLNSPNQISRLNKFWMISHPVDLNDSGVELLINHWGGEVVYFWQSDPDVVEKLTQLGRPKILEVAVPIGLTNHQLSIAEAMVERFLDGSEKTEVRGFDFYSTGDLPPDHLIAVHNTVRSSTSILEEGTP